LKPSDLAQLTDKQKDRLRELCGFKQYDLTLHENGYIFIWPDVDKFDNDCPDIKNCTRKLWKVLRLSNHTPSYRKQDNPYRTSNITLSRIILLALK